MPKLDIRCLISGRQTEGRTAVFEEIVDPGTGPPLHRHFEQVEIFHVIEGKLLFEVDGERIEREAGGTAVVPAGAAHSFRNIGEEKATIHYELLPALNSEEFFERILAAEAGDPESLFRKYGQELVGPPLSVKPSAG